jgi:sister chromatid cohesion protein PDS5
LGIAVTSPARTAQLTLGQHTHVLRSSSQIPTSPSGHRYAHVLLNSYDNSATMPRARNREPSPEQVEDAQDEVMQDGGSALQFDEPLTWRAGKPIAVIELLRRLRTLHGELQSMDQDEAVRDSLVPKAQELANQQLLSHKDKGVKAWTLTCIVEMFRLLAPDAPYKGGQLRQIFDIFASLVIPALANPSDPYNQQHMAILSSLTTIKSIVLVTDIPGSDALILQIFTNCFDVISGNMKGSEGEQLPKNVEYHMTTMLCTIIDECPALPTGVVDVILAQFLRADPNALARGIKKGDTSATVVIQKISPAYNMARSVCNSCPEKMTREIGKYFSSVLIDATESFTALKTQKHRGKRRTYDESEDESDDGMVTPPPEHDLDEVEKAHRLLRELWRSSPDVIQNVVPQMEAEVGAENALLRTMAVQTVGDMVAGIGAAGPPPAPILDPSAYPSQSLETASPQNQIHSVLLTPSAPHAFSSVYPSAYQAFIDRKRDKAATVRSAWVTAVGRIIATSGGGKGLDADQQLQLLRHLADSLADQDERVRLAAVKAVTTFDFNTVVQKLGTNGGVNTPASVLGNLVERIRDPKHHVRVAAMELLGRLWGVGSGAIAEGRERVREILGAIPTKIFMAIFINDKAITAVVQQVTFESLLPIPYPPIKAKAAANGDSHRVRDSQGNTEQDAVDPDATRAERILVLVRDLEPKAKEVFFMQQQRQSGMAKYLDVYLTACGKAYGNAAEGEDGDEKSAKKQLEKLIGVLANTRPEPAIASEHLHKFAKHHDRRSYQLIRFCFSPESDYRKITKALKELVKRMDEAPSGMTAVLETLIPLVHSASLLVYNRSHVPAIMDFARTDEKGLSEAAHEVLTEISTKAPDVFKVHVHELCEGLKKQAPSPESPNSPSALNELKACAGFARRFANEMPKDREFYKAMTSFAKYGSPPKAAKHAVSIIAASAEKREMYIKDTLSYCLTDFHYGAECFLARLAALSQLRLVAHKETEEQEDAILDLAVSKILQNDEAITDDEELDWKDEIDDALCSKLWALRILVNGLRGAETHGDAANVDEFIRNSAMNVYKLLNTIINQHGEMMKGMTSPKHQRAHLRLAAANHLLKLSCTRAYDQFLAARDFNSLSGICQDEVAEVRGGFVRTLKKYLGQGKLPNRFSALVFLYAFEPNKSLKESVTTWLKARAALSAKQQNNLMETVFPRFLSLLAHHQDFSEDPVELADFITYIMFYLKTVATRNNISLIYYIAERVKGVQDGIDPEKSNRLYVMSDLAQAVIRSYRDIQGWPLEVYPNKVRLPLGIFAALPSHTVAQEIKLKNYLPEELDEDTIEELVKVSLKNKKRKSDNAPTRSVKKAKTTEVEKVEKPKAARKAPKTPKPMKTPKKKAPNPVPSSERRKSARASSVKNYAEDDSEDEDEEEVEQWQSDDADKENRVTSSTPPTSDPTPAAAPTQKKAEPPASSQVEEDAPPAGKGKKAAAAAKGKKTASTAASSSKAKKATAPQRSTRSTRRNRNSKAEKEKNILDVPSDSDEALSDVPSGVEA